MIFQSLDKLEKGKDAKIVMINLHGKIRRRLYELGIIPGTTLECLMKSKNDEMSAYLVRDAVIALRREDAKRIITTPYEVVR